MKESFGVVLSDVLALDEWNTGNNYAVFLIFFLKI